MVKGPSCSLDSGLLGHFVKAPQTFKKKETPQEPSPGHTVIPAVHDTFSTMAFLAMNGI